MRSERLRMCVVSATPLTIHFFLKPHLLALSKHFEVTLVANMKSDSYLPPLALPVQELSLGIERKMTPLRDLIALIGLYGFFRRERFDIVVSVVPKAGLLGMLAAWVQRVPRRVHIFQGEVWASRRGLMRLLLKAMDRLTARFATHLLAVSASERDFLESEGVAPRGKVRVLGAGSIVGVDIDRFHGDIGIRARVRSELGIPEDAVLCIFLGRLTSDKGVLDLVQAFVLSASSQTKLWLLIAGPDEEQLSSQIRESVPVSLSKRMVMVGFCKNPENLLAAADFLCLPSYREGFGMAILEAAAVGIPAIGTRIYGITDAIDENRTGVLVEPGDITGLATALTRWCEDPQERQQFAEAAQKRALLKFEQQNVVQGYVNYFCDFYHEIGLCEKLNEKS